MADVFASYRKKSYDSFGIDPLYHISAPGLWSRAMLKMSNARIKLITDTNTHLIIKKRIRGGRCEPIYYHAKANNMCVNRNFEEKRIKNHILLV